MSTPNPITTKWIPLWDLGGQGGSANLKYRGAYQDGQTYMDGNVVLSDGVAYICVKNGTTTPPEVWPEAAGPVGPPGPQGAQGPAGIQGPAGAGVPSPVVNGQWVKGTGGAAVWAAITQGDLPEHLRSPGKLVSDWNTALDNGWYYDNGTVSNAPAGWSYLMGQVFRLSDNYIVQVLYDYGHAASGNPPVQWTRRRVAGTWEAWQVTQAVADSAWIVPTLTGGHSHYAAPYGPVRYRKLASGLVVCDGLMTVGTAGAQAYVFPAGYRVGSGRQPIFGTAASITTAETWRITDTGGLLPTAAAGAGAWISLAGVIFLAEQ